ncbi:Spondin-1 [Chionoecetes opilio]|uniref:Spondin-1 n=1 Tax=Chionoecetes opilio TaxID=41210 RepID=A0A8J5CSY4_CHIOP|nr:Spondin-1 [Chionoecetes opilio]
MPEEASETEALQGGEMQHPHSYHPHHLLPGDDETVRKDLHKSTSPTGDQFNGLQALSQRREVVLSAAVATTTTPQPVPYQPETEPISLHSYDPDQEYISPSLYNPNLGPVYITDDDRHDHDNLKVNCMLGEWGPWSPCTPSCGPEALQQRSRLIVVEARNGGISCGDTTQRRYCTLPPCPRPRPAPLYRLAAERNCTSLTRGSHQNGSAGLFVPL